VTTLSVGGSGFIGSELTARLAARGDDVVVLDIDPPTDVSGSVTTVEGDVTEYDDVVGAINEYNPDTVVTFAYLLGAESDEHPGRAVRLNCVGIDNVFRAASAAGVERVVYASSIAVYGHPDSHDGPLEEDAKSPAAYREYPLLFYSATKQLNEYQARLYAERSDTEFVAVRPSIVFGPGREGGLTEWASAIVTNPVNNDPVHLPFQPDQRLGLVYRDDVVDLVEAVIDAETVSHHAYNTGDVTVTAQELADAAAEKFGGEVTFDHEADSLPLVADASHQRASTEFGYELTGLRTAMQRHADEIE
jgi:UDP-glucose 4-epimerase